MRGALGDRVSVGSTGFGFNWELQIQMMGLGSTGGGENIHRHCCSIQCMYSYILE